jgi:hypothetical protein
VLNETQVIHSRETIMLRDYIAPGLLIAILVLVFCGLVANSRPAPGAMMQVVAYSDHW